MRIEDIGAVSSVLSATSKQSMKHLHLAFVVSSAAMLAACGAPVAHTVAPIGSPNPEAAVAACKSALAVRESVNPYMVIPMSHVAIAGGFEIFLSLQGVTWLCMTDPYNNVNSMQTNR